MLRRASAMVTKIFDPARLARLSLSRFFLSLCGKLPGWNETARQLLPRGRGYPEDGAPTGKFGMELGYPMSKGFWPRTRANAAGVNGKARPAVEARIAEK